MDQLRPTISNQPNLNHQPQVQPRLPVQLIQRLEVETDVRDRVEEEQRDEIIVEGQNDTNVIQVEIHRQNTPEESDAPDDIQVTLEEDQNSSSTEQEEPTEKENEPETPEDIMKSPLKEKDSEDKQERNHSDDCSLHQSAYYS